MDILGQVRNTGRVVFEMDANAPRRTTPRLACCVACALAVVCIGEHAAAQAQGQRTSDAVNAIDLLERGRVSLRAGDRYAALEAIAQAQRLQPGNLEIAHALAD